MTSKTPPPRDGRASSPSMPGLEDVIQHNKKASAPAQLVITPEVYRKFKNCVGSNDPENRKFVDWITMELLKNAGKTQRMLNQMGAEIEHLKQIKAVDESSACSTGHHRARDQTAQFNLPSGYRFLPTNKELVADFLFKKLIGRLSPVEAMLIPECDLYGKEEPWFVYERFASKPNSNLYVNNDLYFFTRLSKNKGSKIVMRRVRVTGGTWHGEDTGKKITAKVEIIDRQLVHIEGVVKRFKYKNKNSDQDCGWIMHELNSLPEFNGNIVLCRLRKSESANKRRKIDSEH